MTELSQSDRAPIEQEITQEIAQAIEFAREVVAPQASSWELERKFPRETLALAAETGLTGLLVPVALGGKGVSCATLSRVLEALASADLSLAFSLVVHNNLMGAIARYGTETLRARYLPAMNKMDLLGAFLLTEPGGGSDAAAITTSAARTVEGWVLNGEKAWVTNGSDADLLSVYAQTDPAAGWRGIAAFLVEADTPGVIRESPYNLLGGHALGTTGFRFEDCRIDEENLLVPVGEGFKAAMAGIDLARTCVAAMCVGMLQASLDLAIIYLKERRAFGRVLAEQQGLQWQLADVATDLHAARLMIHDATAKLDSDSDATVAAAHAKKFATRVALQGISDCMQSLGATGLRHDYPLARHLASAKIAQYLDGTTEIQNLVISRSLFR